MKKTLLFAGFITMLIACNNKNKDNEMKVVVNTPTVQDILSGNDFSRINGVYNNVYIDNYTSLFTRDGEVTVSFSGQTTRLKQAKEIGENLNTNVAVADIQLKFEGEDVNGSLQSAGFSEASLNGTTRIVRSKTSASIGLFNKTNGSGQGATNVAEFDAYISRHQAIIDNWFTPAASRQAGTFLDSDGSIRYVDAKGFELDQLFTKGLVGALVYDQAVNHYFNRLDDEYNGSNNYRTENEEGTPKEGESYTTMEHHWDEAFGYIYGNITGQNLIYKYIDNVDALQKFTGTERQILEAFVKGRIAIVEKDYSTRDTQIAILREKLGLVIAVRAVHYLGGGVKLLRDLAEDAPERTNAFHDLSEGYGFVNSLRYIVDANGTRYFTDVEVDGYIATLEANNGLWSVNPDDLVDIADEIAAKSVGGSSWTYRHVLQ